MMFGSVSVQEWNSPSAEVSPDADEKKTDELKILMADASKI